MFKRTRYQEGSVSKEKRKRGADVWTFRWREVAPDGKPKRMKIIIGTAKEYPTLAHARKQLATLELNINDHPSQGAHPAVMTMGQLISHYKEYELGENRLNKAESTVEVYTGYLNDRILPKWEDTRIWAMKPTEVEVWLRSLNLADGTKAKIRNIMSAVFQHALRHQFIKVNPIRGLVRQSAKRRREPDVLTAEEIRLILKRLSPFHQTLVFLAASTGLRFSEMRGLQWQDIDFVSGVLHLRRGVVRHHITELKTEASRKPVPLHPALVAALLKLRQDSAYCQPGDWVFASSYSKGKVPIWPASVMSDHVQPTAKASKIVKHITWHVFRHSYATLLKSNGEDVKVVQDSLRHANFHITMDLYAQSIAPAVRLAHGRVVEQLVGDSPGLNLIGPGSDLNQLNLTVSC